jgi:hypothetical protein
MTEQKTLNRCITKATKVAGLSFALFLAVLSPKTNAEEAAPPANNTRGFYQVLDEVLSDFEYDLKAGQVGGLKDLSIRNVATSENIPPSFKSHLELLISERILKTSKTRIVHCIACRSKRATLNGDSMTIASPDSNSAELSRIAKMNGIQNFMDVAFAYQPSGMILSLEISDSETGTLIWSKSYNSDSTRASAQKRGVDYQEVQDAQAKMEYQPTIQIRPVLYTAFEPKASSGYASVLGLGFRMMERYDNRKKEVGFEVDYFESIPSLVGQPGASSDKNNIYSSFNLTFLFTHAWNLFGDEENYNKARGQIYAGIGGTYASGFLGAVVRGGYEWHLAKHWAITTFLGYRPQATVVIDSTKTVPLSGVEGGLGVGFLF